jgi:predicted nucleic acid-binding protein
MSSAGTASRLAAYLDASALVKLVWDEPESVELERAMHARDVVTSDLAVAEVPRAVRRRARADLSAELETLLQSVALVPLEIEVLSLAGALPGSDLGALDAIHVASALTIAEDIDVFVSYDRRQLDAASGMGLAVASPGA